MHKACAGRRRREGGELDAVGGGGIGRSYYEFTSWLLEAFDLSFALAITFLTLFELY